MIKVYIAYVRNADGYYIVNKVFSNAKAYWNFKLERLKKELSSSKEKSKLFTDQSDKALLNILKLQKNTPNSLPHIFELEK